MKRKQLNALDGLISMIEDFARHNWVHVNVSDIHYNVKVCEKVVEYLEDYERLLKKYKCYCDKCCEENKKESY